MIKSIKTYNDMSVRSVHNVESSNEFTLFDYYKNINNVLVFAKNLLLIFSASTALFPFSTRGKRQLNLFKVFAV